MKTILYVGLEAPKRTDINVIHCPLIEIIPKPHDSPQIIDAFSKLSTVTHFIMTSKIAVRCFFTLLANSDLLHNKQFLSVGQSTTNYLKSFTIEKILTASTESQEGVIELIQKEQPTNPLFFWGHSSLSRSLLPNFLKNNNLSFIECVLYETIHKLPEKTLCFDEIDEIFFSSPSTVDAFCFFFGSLPKNKKLHAQGSITHLAIKQRL